MKHQAPTSKLQRNFKLYDGVLPQEMVRSEKEVGSALFNAGNYARAAKLFSEMSKSKEFAEFLTLPIYELTEIFPSPL